MASIFGGSLCGSGIFLWQVCARLRDRKELLRLDSPAAAPPDINFHMTIAHFGRRGGSPKKEKSGGKKGGPECAGEALI